MCVFRLPVSSSIQRHFLSTVEWEDFGWKGSNAMKKHCKRCAKSTASFHSALSKELRL